MPRIVTDIDATEVVMMLAPEPTATWPARPGKAWGSKRARDHVHLALHREDEKIRFRDIQAQPRKIISSPTWSGLESEKVSYNAGYTNVHELIPWRTLTGRQQFYQDHPGCATSAKALSAIARPCTSRRWTRSKARSPTATLRSQLNFITPHQKWGIHSTYSDNLMMLTLNRGGRCVAERRTTPRAPASWTTTGWSCSTPTAPLRPVRW